MNKYPRSSISKVSIFISNLGLGGAEKILIDLANEMVKHDIQVDLVLVKAKGKHLASASPKIRIINLNSRHPILAIPKVRRYILATKPSIIMSSTEMANSVLAIISRITHSDTKVILRISNILSLVYKGTSLLNALFIKTASKYFYRFADRIIAVSKGVREDAFQVTKYHREIEVIYNPVITSDFFRLKDERPTHQWLLDEKCKVILAVGRFHSQKDYPTLLKAFTIVRGITDARLIILGDGAKKTEIKKIVKVAGLSNWVDMPGFVNNPLPYFINSDVFVLSSLYEGLSNSLVQAVACQCPVVSTDNTTNASEVVNDGENGYLVRISDYEDMAEKILQILTGKFKISRLNSLRKFTMDVAFKNYMKLFQEELSGGHD